LKDREDRQQQRRADDGELQARQIITGSVQKGGLTAAQFRTNLLCPQLPATIPCSGIIVNLETFSEASFPGGFYSFVLLGAVWLPTITTTFQGQTVALASAAAAFKNEPYTAPNTKS
jgi:hypothetical protein